MIILPTEESLIRYEKIIKSGKILTHEEKNLILFGSRHPETMGTKDGKPKHSKREK